MNDSQYPADKLRKYIIIGFLALLVLEGIYFIFTHSFVVVKTNQSITGAKLYLSRLGEDNANQTSPGLHLVKTGDYILSARKDISMAKQPFHIGIFQVKKVGVTIDPQKQAFKIASGAEQCPAGSLNDMRKGILISYDSYDCRHLSTAFINTFTKRSVKNQLVTGEYNIDASEVQPFKNGVVGLVGSDIKGLSFVYINSSGLKTINLSEYTPDTNVGDYKLSVDNNKLYLFNVAKKTLFTFDSLNSKPSKANLSLKNEGSQTRPRQFQVQDGRIYIVSTSAKKTHTEKFDKGNLYIYNTSGKLENMINVDNYINNVIGFSALSANTFISKPVGANAYVFKLKNGKLSLYDTLFNVDQAVSAKHYAYLLIDGDIYEYKPNGTESLVFHSPNIQVSSLRVVGPRLLFNGQLTSGENPINLTYMLTDKPVKSQLDRMENYLPYPPTPLVSWMDYLGNKITFAPQLLSLGFRGATNTPSYSQLEYQYKSSEIKQELRTDGFTSNKYQVVSYPY